MVNKLKAYIFLVGCILIGIVIISMLRHGEINWTVLSRTFVLSILFSFSLLLIHIEAKKSR